MALHDHFRPPLGVRRHWHGFHNGWAYNIAAALNEKLPPRYFALERLAPATAWRVTTSLYATAYRPVERAGKSHLDVWEEPLTPGSGLPTMPLWLRGALCLPVELEATYHRTCREVRISEG